LRFACFTAAEDVEEQVVTKTTTVVEKSPAAAATGLSVPIVLVLLFAVKNFMSN